MSKELKNIADAVMGKIHKDNLKMRPRMYFVIGSILAFIGLVSSVVFSVFLVGLIRFSLRSHGPRGSYRLEELLSNFPWWAPILAIIGLVTGLWLLRRYDFSYKINFKVIIIGFVMTVLVAGLIMDMVGLNEILTRRGPMKGMMRRYLEEDSMRNKESNWIINRGN